jgi:hypothetical protein
MKNVARVDRVLQPGIHKVAEIRDGDVHPIADMPHPVRVEIELQAGPEQPCMMYRYTSADELCGDTWHATLADAFHQAKFEYGLSQADFSVPQGNG